MKVALVKESSLLNAGILHVLKDLLKGHDIQAYGANTADTLLKQMADLLIIDLDTNIDYMAFIDTYKKHNKKVIIWTSNCRDERLIDLFKQDLSGYFYNGMEIDELKTAIHKILKGTTYVHPELTPLLLGDYIKIHKKEPIKPVGILTKREWEILELLVNGFKNSDIANKLFISQKTVKNHVASILEKLDVKDRTNAVLFALKNRWFSI